MEDLENQTIQKERIRRKLRTKFVLYTCISVGTLLHIFIFQLQTIKNTSKTINLRSFDIGCIFGIYCLLSSYTVTIKYVYTVLFYMLFIFISMYYIYQNDEFNQEFLEGVLGRVIFFVIFCTVSPYFSEKYLREDFLKNKQIEVLITEQKNLFEHLPDGLVIHSNEIANEAEGTTELSIKYLN